MVVVGGGGRPVDKGTGPRNGGGAGGARAWKARTGADRAAGRWRPASCARDPFLPLSRSVAMVSYQAPRARRGRVFARRPRPEAWGRAAGRKREGRLRAGFYTCLRRAPCGPVRAGDVGPNADHQKQVHAFLASRFFRNERGLGRDAHAMHRVRIRLTARRFCCVLSCIPLQENYGARVTLASLYGPIDLSRGKWATGGH